MLSAVLFEVLALALVAVLPPTLPWERLASPSQCLLHLENCPRLWCRLTHFLHLITLLVSVTYLGPQPKVELVGRSLVVRVEAVVC